MQRFFFLHSAAVYLLHLFSRTLSNNSNLIIMTCTVYCLCLCNICCHISSESKFYIHLTLVFGSTAFKLFTLGPITFGQFWSISPDRTSVNELLKFFPQIFYQIKVRALWWLLHYFDFVVLKPFCHSFVTVWFGMVSLQSLPMCNKAALTLWLMSWDVVDDEYIHIVIGHYG